MHKPKIKLGLIFGGRSGEHEVSLNSARSVYAAVNKDKYDVTLIGITKTGQWLLSDDAITALTADSTHGAAMLLPDPTEKALLKVSTDADVATRSVTPLTELDVVFPVMHGTFGEDGAIQGLFEMADLAYVGSGVVGSAVGMDKSIFKAVMQANNIPVLPYVNTTRTALNADAAQVMAEIEGALTYPVFIKPANLGSSVGISKASNAAELEAGLIEAARWDRRIVIEQGVDAREIEVSVLGNDEPIASIAGEIAPKRDFYDYEAKYVSDDSDLIIPAELSEADMQSMRALAVDAYKAIDCAGLSRVDFLMDRNTDEVWINEINTLPGFTSISMYPKLWAASGIEYSELIDKLIELALERKQDRDVTVRSFDVPEA